MRKGASSTPCLGAIARHSFWYFHCGDFAKKLLVDFPFGIQRLSDLPRQQVAHKQVTSRTVGHWLKTVAPMVACVELDADATMLIGVMAPHERIVPVSGERQNASTTKVRGHVIVYITNKREFVVSRPFGAMVDVTR